MEPTKAGLSKNSQDYVAELARIDGNHFMCEYDDFKVRNLALVSVQVLPGLWC